VLDERAVSGLVVSRMEAVLEYCRFDIVTFLPFLIWDGFHFAPDLRLLNLLFGEVSPCLLSVGTIDLDFPFALLDGYGSYDLCRMLVNDFKCMPIRHVQVVPRRLPPVFHWQRDRCRFLLQNRGCSYFGFENSLVYLGSYFLVELVVPSCLVVILTALTLAQQFGGGETEYIKLFGFGTLSEHKVI